MSQRATDFVFYIAWPLRHVVLQLMGHRFHLTDTLLHSVSLQLCTPQSSWRPWICHSSSCLVLSCTALQCRAASRCTNTADDLFLFHYVCWKTQIIRSPSWIRLLTYSCITKLNVKVQRLKTNKYYTTLDVESVFIFIDINALHVSSYMGYLQ